jgi:gliding motility-associated-like protein
MMRCRLLILTALLLFFNCSTLLAQIITTIAGNHTYGFSGAGGPATSAAVAELYGIAVDNAGNVYAADQSNNVIWKISTAGIITLYAGNGTAGYSGDGGPASAALLFFPGWMGMDPAGNLYFTDQKGIYIREISAAGIISTVAGNPAALYSGGDGGPFTAATFNGITGIVPDNAGNIYITDANTVRMVNPAGIINTIAGTGTPGFSGDGGPALQAQLNSPYGVGVDNAGNIYIPDNGNQRIRKINSAGIISTIAGNGTAGFTGNSGPAINATLHNPWQLTADNNGNVYFDDALNLEIRKIDNTGVISDYAGDGVFGSSGDGGPANLAEITYPTALVCDNAGNLYFDDLNNNVVRKVSNCLTAQIASQPANNSVCVGGSTSFTFSVTNAASYQWQVNTGTGWTNLSDAGAYSGSATSSLSVTSVVASMNSYQYHCLVTNSCATITTLPATLTVNTSATPIVTIAASPGAICSGTPLSFMASPTNGGSAPVYQWQLNGTNVGTNSPSYTENNPATGDVVSCQLTTSVTCVATPTVSSNSLSLTVNPPVTPGLSIAASAPEICSGATASFMASPTNGGAAPVYQWQVNGTNTGSNSPSYSSNNLVNGDIVSCVLASDAVCATAPTAISNSVTLTVNPLLTPALTIAASAQSICSGATVSYTATATNGGGAPAYQWQLNGNNTGTNSPFYVNNTLSNGDVISCTLTSDATCLTGPTITAAISPITVQPLLTPGVNITASAAVICQGTSVEFMANPVNGGSTPSFQWQLNGINTGTNNPIYTNANLANGDIVDCIMAPDANCEVVPTAMSNPLVEQVNPIVISSVSIATATTIICAGTDVTFTATPTNGGGIPVYQWQVNGSNAGTSDPFLTSSLTNGDVVSCIMTSSLSCSSPVGSVNTIVMTVNPVPTVDLMPDTIIAYGEPVTLNGVIGGDIASYQWTPATGLDNPSAAAPVASPASTTTYQLTVESDAGCTATGKVTIGVFRSFEMPNAFTPNGDGKNDIFRIPPSIGVKITAFVVFNRWGARVFMTDNSGVGWDGTFGGQPQPAGAYVWQIEYEDVLTQKPARAIGTVLLIR